MKSPLPPSPASTGASAIASPPASAAISRGASPGGTRTAGKASFARHLTSYLFLLPYGTSFIVFILVPFIVSAGLAFMQYDLTSRTGAKFVGLRNFTEALTDPYFWMSLRFTLLFTLMMVPAAVVTALALALGMNAMLSGRNVVRAALFIPGMLNVAVVGILWQWFYNREFGLFAYLLSLVNITPIPFLSEKWLAVAAIVLMNLWWSVGGTAVIFLTGLQQIPGALYEAAQIDGATTWQRFTTITLPMLKPVMLFVAVMQTIGAFQVFGQPFILTRGGPELFTRGAVQYIYENAFLQYRMGYGAALSWLLFILICAFAFVQHRVLRKVGE